MRPIEVKPSPALAGETRSTAAVVQPPKPWIAQAPWFFLGLFVIACGWDKAVWTVVAAYTRPTIKAWEDAGPFSSIGAAAYMGIKVLGTVWVPAIIGAVLILRAFIQPDTQLVKRAIRRGVLIFLCPAAAGLAAEALKLVFHRMRPEFGDGLYRFRFTDFWSSSGLGLPSSHAAPAVAFALALAAVFPRYVLAFVVLAVLVCLSRVLAGAHYLSDAYAGAVVGLTAAQIVIAFDLKNNHHRPVSEPL